MKRGLSSVQIDSTVHRLAAVAAIRLRKKPVYDGRGATIREIVERGIRREVEDLERVHNAGNPFRSSKRPRPGRPPLIAGDSR